MQQNFSYTFLDGLKCTLENHIEVKLHWNSGYDNEPEAKDSEPDSFTQRKFSPLRLQFCENLNNMYVGEAWVFSTKVE